jgi:hypothetical protein
MREVGSEMFGDATSKQAVAEKEEAPGLNS